MKRWNLTALAVVATLWPLPLPANADSADARCDVYPAGSDHTDKMIPCVFSQRQGHVTIRRSDGVVHDLTPEGDAPGNYRDQDGRRVYRQSGLGDQGLIFRLPEESVFVYWDTAALDPPSGDDNPTAPFTTKDYDATTILSCRAAGDEEFGNCPAGISRMEDRQASITVQSQLGQRFTINFMKDYVNATGGRQVEAKLEGDTWTVIVDGKEEYRVPLAAIEGG